MLGDVFTLLVQALTGSIFVAASASLAWGVLSIALSPCHLASIPLIVGFLTGGGLTARRTAALSTVFASGILSTVVIIGLVTASLGRLMGDIGTLGNYAVAGIFLLMGLYLMDVITLPSFGLDLRPTQRRGFGAAFTLGLLFGAALGPCTFAFMAPVIGVVFRTATTDLRFGLILFTAFAIGHCGVIAGAGSLATTVQRYLKWTADSHATAWLRRVCGFLVVLGGVYLILTIP